jgi:hypothetical protein
MRSQAITNLIYAQLSFFFFLTIAILITTAGFSNNHGLSFYGEHLSTIIPYGTGFLLCDFFLLRAADALPKSQPPFKKLASLLKILAVLLLLILLTPDTVNSFFDWSHIISSFVLFIFELSFASWLTIRWYSDRLIWLLLIAQFLTGVLAMLSQFHIVYYLSEGILFFQIFFGLLLIRSVSGLLERPGTTKHTTPQEPYS